MRFFRLLVHDLLAFGFVALVLVLCGVSECVTAWAWEIIFPNMLRGITLERQSTWPDHYKLCIVIPTHPHTIVMRNVESSLTAYFSVLWLKFVCNIFENCSPKQWHKTPNHDLLILCIYILQYNFALRPVYRSLEPFEHGWSYRKIPMHANL